MLKPIDRETEASLIDRIDHEEMATHLDAFEGTHRTSDTDDELAAAGYVVETFRSYGVDADLEAVDALVSVPESASLDVARADRTVEVTTVSFGASTPPEGVTADTVYLDDVGGATALPDLSGRCSLVPELPKPHLAVAADEANAAAVLFGSPDEHLRQGVVSPVWGTPDPDGRGPPGRSRRGGHRLRRAMTGGSVGQRSRGGDASDVRLDDGDPRAEPRRSYRRHRERPVPHRR
jgi:hypothetical protein